MSDRGKTMRSRVFTYLKIAVRITAALLIVCWLFIAGVILSQMQRNQSPLGNFIAAPTTTAPSQVTPLPIPQIYTNTQVPAP